MKMYKFNALQNSAIDLSYKFYNDPDYDILSIYQVAKLLNVDKNDIYDYVNHMELIIVKDILYTKRWYIFRRDLINFVSYILNRKIETVYTRYYKDALPYYGDTLYLENIKSILDLPNIECTRDIVINNGDLYPSYRNNNLTVSKYNFLRFMWWHRRFIPNPRIKNKITCCPNPDIYFNPINLFEPRVDAFIPASEKIKNPFITNDVNSNINCYFNR